MSDNVSKIFESVQASMQGDEKIRESIRAARDIAEPKVREAHRSLGSLNSATDLQQAAKLSVAMLKEVGPLILAMEKELPDGPGGFHRFFDLWRYLLQLISTCAVVLEFVTNDNLADVAKVKEMVGADIKLPVEEYLSGVTKAVSELNRLCMNRVIKSDFAMSQRCLTFGSNVFEGFKLLNLKNDHLRKNFDGMKYDIKKMEEIVYDLSVRGLLKSADVAMKTGEPAAKKVKVDKDAADGKMEC